MMNPLTSTIGDTMSLSAANTMLLEFVAIANDQTDGLIRLMQNYRDTPRPMQDRDFELIINHMKLLQRSLAKAVDSEIETMQQIDRLLSRIEND